MTRKVFIISDTHFSHENFCNFTDEHGNFIRPWRNVHDMDEALVENWNSVVSPSDKVYHLGDVWMRSKHRHIVGRLNGDKVLIKGNHDVGKLSDYTPYFRDIRGSHVLAKCILTHIPVYEEGLQRFKGNIHGHLHEKRVLQLDNTIDPRYVSVCVEHTNYTPILLDKVVAQFETTT